MMVFPSKRTWDAIGIRKAWNNEIRLVTEGMAEPFSGARSGNSNVILKRNVLKSKIEELTRIVGLWVST